MEPIIATWPDDPQECKATAAGILSILVASDRRKGSTLDSARILDALNLVDWSLVAGQMVASPMEEIMLSMGSVILRGKPLRVKDHVLSSIAAAKYLGRCTADDQALDFLIQVWAILASNEPLNSIVRQVLQWNARWGQMAFPSVKLTRAQAANFMISDPPPHLLETLKAPWPAFVIQLEDWPFMVDAEMLTMNGMQRGVYPIHSVYVQQFKSQISSCVDGSRSLDQRWTLRIDVGMGHLWQQNRTAVELDALNEYPLNCELPFEAVLPSEQRAMCLLSKMVLNVVVALVHGDGGERIHRNRKKNRKPRKGELAVRDVELLEYRISSPVTVDPHKYVQEYVHTGKGTPRKSRWWVRGFWRDQKHGPGRTLTKQVFIEAHERGHKNAPLLVRDHQLKEE